MDTNFDNSIRYPRERAKNHMSKTDPLTFADIVKQNQSVSFERAVKVVQMGHPNVYIGNGHVFNNCQRTALTVFISEKEVKHIKWSLEQGADPNQPSMWTKDFIAAGEAKYPEDWDGKPVNFPLQLALETGIIEIVQLLLSHGALWENIDVTSILQYVAEYHAWRKETSCAKLLLEQGAKILSSKYPEYSALRTMRKKGWSSEQLHELFGNEIDDEYYCTTCKAVGFTVTGDPNAPSLKHFECSLCKNTIQVE